MDQAPKTPNVLLLRRTYTEEESGAWLRLFKALRGFTQVAQEIRDEPIQASELQEMARSFDLVLTDLSLLEGQPAEDLAINNILLTASGPLPWNASSRSAKLPLFARYPCLLLEQLSAPDLIRILHLLLMPKRLAGVVPLMEKGSLIVAEKVQSTEALGTLLDKLCLYFSRTEGFELKERVPDLRQVLSALLLEAFRQARSTAEIYPTVDFQVGMNKQKIAVNLRFPRGSLPIKEIPWIVLEGRDALWQQAWACSDLMMVTHHTQYDEIEVSLLFNRVERRPFDRFGSFLTRESNRSVRKEDLFTVSNNFRFHVLSDIRLKEKEELRETAAEDNPELDLNSLPEETVEKLAKLTQETQFLKDQVAKKDDLLREAHGKILEISKALRQKQGEFVRISKSSAIKISNLQRKVEGLEKSANRVSESKPAVNNITEAGQINQLQETISRLEHSLRTVENEKNNSIERATKEQKKVAVFEQKYTALYRDLGVKDKELSELKAQAIKLKKELATQLAQTKGSEASSGAQDGLAAKLKESEAREFVLKQELRKLAFKAENYEKNVKAIQQEAAEKSKLLEQKLQVAKTKELELIKKADDLSALLKKASKAA